MRARDGGGGAGDMAAFGVGGPGRGAGGEGIVRGWGGNLLAGIS